MGNGDDKGLVAESYAGLLAEFKERIGQAQIRAATRVNTELVLLYWELGRTIVARQDEEGWGRSVIERLSTDLRVAFPHMKGFSPRNLWRMRSFFLAWKEHDEILPQPVAELPWGHNAMLLEKLDAPEERIWYASKVKQYSWSRDVLAFQISTKLHLREGKALANFDQTLPEPQSDLAHQVLKDPYVFDFLSIGDEAQERAIEKALMEHIRAFLLELGVGFSFVGNQVRLDVGEKEFFVDMLFYHLKLRCFVVLELKAGEFKPEYAGKMNFYLNAVDDLMRHPDDQPSVGLILCRTRDRLTVEYALRGIKAPVGVAEYITTDALPEDLKGSLPTVEELEAGLDIVESSGE